MDGWRRGRPAAQPGAAVSSKPQTPRRPPPLPAHARFPQAADSLETDVDQLIGGKLAAAAAAATRPSGARPAASRLLPAASQQSLEEAHCGAINQASLCKTSVIRWRMLPIRSLGPPIIINAALSVCVGQ